MYTPYYRAGTQGISPFGDPFNDYTFASTWSNHAYHTTNPTVDVLILGDIEGFVGEKMHSEDRLFGSSLMQRVISYVRSDQDCTVIRRSSSTGLDYFWSQIPHPTSYAFTRRHQNYRLHEFQTFDAFTAFNTCYNNLFSIGIMVIDAEFGVTDRTLEQLTIAEAANCKDYLIFVDKTHLIEEDELREIHQQLHEAFAPLGRSLQDIMFVRNDNSEVSSDGLRICDALETIARKVQDEMETERRRRDGLFAIVEDWQTAATGVNVLLHVQSGALRVGDILKLINDYSSERATARVTSFIKRSGEVTAGGRATVHLDLPPDYPIRKGYILVDEDSPVAPVHYIAGIIFLCDSYSNLMIEGSAQVQCMIRDRTSPSVVSLTNTDMLITNEIGYAIAQLRQPLVVMPRDIVVLSFMEYALPYHHSYGSRRFYGAMKVKEVWDRR